MCVVGLGFDSTSPAFVRSRASQAAGSDGRLAQKHNRSSISGGRDCVDTICADLCSIPTSCWLCLLGTALFRLSSSLCHQTVVFHIYTQDYAVSLNFERSSKVQVRARMVYFSMCAVFSVARLHSHVVSPFLPLLRDAYVTCT